MQLAALFIAPHQLAAVLFLSGDRSSSWKVRGGVCGAGCCGAANRFDEVRAEHAEVRLVASWTSFEC
ncbi:hypothetical protein KC19_3G093600 [Ceratodon purpureus]|uniref:Secreted protein n=1 Tax=Ceratodon purpureus TaxID=3225 RepID=A0A8T0IJ16_CERPU|nr:hypothetical protein KC19_3G093600 [Ceratodon purpureus]